MILRSPVSGGNDAMSPAVYGCAGLANSSDALASSTMSPEYMIAIRSENSTSSDRSWVMKSTAKPISRCRNAISWRISRWTITSRAVVGSSSSKSSGPSAIAIAITTRCRMPPESSCGYERSRFLSMPTTSSSSAAFMSAKRFEIFWCARNMSTNWSPMRVTGLSELMALCMTSATLRQRMRRSSVCRRPTRSRPLNRICPPAMRPGGRSTCRIAFAIVLLPHPDSPASPTIWPGWIVREIPFTAVTAPWSVPYSTTRSRSSRSGALTSDSASRDSAATTRLTTRSEA